MPIVGPVGNAGPATEAEKDTVNVQPALVAGADKEKGAFFFGPSALAAHAGWRARILAQRADEVRHVAARLKTWSPLHVRRKIGWTSPNIVHELYEAYCRPAGAGEPARVVAIDELQRFEGYDDDLCFVPRNMLFEWLRADQIFLKSKASTFRQRWLYFLDQMLCRGGFVSPLAVRRGKVKLVPRWLVEFIFASVEFQHSPSSAGGEDTPTPPPPSSHAPTPTVVSPNRPTLDQGRVWIKIGGRWEQRQRLHGKNQLFVDGFSKRCCVNAVEGVKPPAKRDCWKRDCCVEELWNVYSRTVMLELISCELVDGAQHGSVHDLEHFLWQRSTPGFKSSLPEGEDDSIVPNEVVRFNTGRVWSWFPKSAWVEHFEEPMNILRASGSGSHTLETAIDRLRTFMDEIGDAPSTDSSVVSKLVDDMTHTGTNARCVLHQSRLQIDNRKTTFEHFVNPSRELILLPRNTLSHYVLILRDRQSCYARLSETPKIHILEGFTNLIDSHVGRNERHPFAICAGVCPPCVVCMRKIDVQRKTVLGLAAKYEHRMRECVLNSLPSELVLSIAEFI